MTRCTIAFLRRISPNSKITLSTHFSHQDLEFALPADKFVERDLSGETNAEIYASTIECITPDTISIHVGGDNYCYKNWQRWSTIHRITLERGAYSVLWSCSIDPIVIDSEMLAALKSHHLITARESITYNALIERGCTNVIKVRDIAFDLSPEPIDIVLKNYIALNISPMAIRKNPLVLPSYQTLVDYILRETDMNIALVPHVVQSVDNDYQALQMIDTPDSERIMLMSDKFSAAQYKYIISKARCCVTARTHIAISAYSSGVPTLAVGYSTKAFGIAREFNQPVIDIFAINDANALKDALRGLLQ